MRRVVLTKITDTSLNRVYYELEIILGEEFPIYFTHGFPIVSKYYAHETAAMTAKLLMLDEYEQQDEVE